MGELVSTRIGHFVLLALTGAAVCAASLVGFILIARTELSPFKVLFLAAYCAASLGLFLYAARVFPLTWLFGLASVIAVLSMIFFELLAFGLFPGLAKDIRPFDDMHLQQIASMLAVLLCWHCGLAVVARVFTRRWSLPAV